ncbi:PREDICTED: putative F-box [Prunus dulcis]|uniref:PREDICTED: putative F-box n=1 Tax=Prunus dulcis TaxID=3755 RepID=A0A5E4EZ90_PRUDU|nr:PREDICTED: putative F-box [Prunus dulcis]
MGRGIWMQARNILGRASDHIAMDHYAPQSLKLMLRSIQFPPLNARRCLSPSDQKFFKSSHPACKKNRFDCVGSIEGWLIMVDNQFWHPDGFNNSTNIPWSLFHLLHNSRKCLNFFFDPKYEDRVMLPSQSTVPCHGSNQPNFFKKVVASSSPTASGDCLVAALCSGGRLAFCTPSDQSWTLIDQGSARGVEFCDVEIIDGKLHAALSNLPELLMVFKIESGANRPRTYFAQYLVRLEPVPIPSHATTKDGGQEGSALKELFMKNVLHRNYSFDLEEEEEEKDPVGFGPGKLRRVIKQNWLNIQRMQHQAQGGPGSPQAPGLLCLVK